MNILAKIIKRVKRNLQINCYKPSDSGYFGKDVSVSTDRYFI